jgi:molecular chaperone DnaK (HSP70)
MAFAIDFGTSNTVVARWNAALNQPEVVNLPHLAWRLGTLPPLVPSLVHVNDARSGQVLVGQPVRNRGLDRAQGRFFRNFKRGIGTSVQGFMPEIDGQLVSFEQIGQWFLSALIGELKAQEGDLQSLIFTVPVDSFEAYRLWLGKLCQQLDIEQVRMLDEPTAAALGYGLSGGETLLANNLWAFCSSGGKPIWRKSRLKW